MPPTILITRPDPSGAQFADQVQAEPGCDVPIVLSPQMRIEYCEALPDLQAFALLIFTSRNGVAAFAAQTARRDIPCITVGHATAQAARRAGLQAQACDGTSADLIACLVNQDTKTPCLHIRGEHVTGDVAGDLRQAGVAAQEAILYRQVAQQLSDEAVKLLRRESPVILPLFSPRSAQLFFSGTDVKAPILIAAISQNVAAEVPTGRARIVLVAEKPDAPGVLNLLPQLCEAAKRLEGEDGPQ